MKKLLGFAAALLMCAALCACDDEVASVKEITEYAEQNFGKAEFVSSITGSENERVCYFTDGQYGFDYYVESRVSGVGMDGSIFGFSEGKLSDFDEAYYATLRSLRDDDIAAIELSLGVEIKLADMFYARYALADITSENVQNSCKAAEQLRALLKEYDSRSYWENIYCYVKDSGGNTLYTYDILHEQPLTPEDVAVEEFTQHAKDFNPKAKYSHKTTQLFSKTGLTQSDVVSVLGDEPITDSSIITYYYFTAEGKQFFVADVYVYDGAYMRWFTDYYKVFPEK